MPEVTHDSAIYYDENNVSQPIVAKDLHDNAVFEKAKLATLFDKTGQIRLSARPSKNGTRHFYEIGERMGNRVLYEGEDDTTHNDRVNSLAKSLQLHENYDLDIDWRNKVGKPSIENLFKMTGYRWGAEIHRIMNQNSIVRHDIYGQSNDLSMSIQRPAVAIEVIYTHFPEEAAFDAMLEASRNIPLIVLFDFTAKPNSFVKVSKSTKIIQITRWTFYIKNGKVWHDGETQAIASSARLKIEVDALFERWGKFKYSQN